MEWGTAGPGNGLNMVSAFLEEHGLPAVHFHSLRHTNASLLIAAHVPITTVSGRLGHAQTSTTLNFYASAIQSADAAAADALEGVIKIGEKLMHEVFKVYHLKLVKTNCWGYIQEDIVG